MFYLRNLRVQLQERRNRLYRNGYRTYRRSSCITSSSFSMTTRIPNPLLETLDAGTPLDFEQWVSEQPEAPRRYSSRLQRIAEPKFASAYLEKMRSEMRVVENGFDGVAAFSSEKQFDAMLHDFSEAVVDPVVNFLHDRIDDAGNVLYLIERFKLQGPSGLTVNEFYEHLPWTGLLPARPVLTGSYGGLCLREALITPFRSPHHRLDGQMS